jgi:hypothetical protein
MNLRPPPNPLIKKEGEMKKINLTVLRGLGHDCF